ncbi:MAG: hypothetical protein ACO1OT_12525 [Heyndrickxia sp.]
MKKPIIITSLIGFGLLLTCFALYWFYFSKPSPFPDSYHLMKKLDDSFPEASVEKVQGYFPMDNRHFFVPFITKENKYGFSCWTWKKHKWELTAMNTMGEPFLWKINERDPSTYRIIWNLHPNDHIRSIRFFMIRDRGYHVSEGVEHYDPKIQMNEDTSLKEKSYGFMKLPKNWGNLIRSNNEVEIEKQPDFFTINFFPRTSVYFGWIPYDEDGKLAKLNNSMYGSGFGRLGSDLEDIRFMTGKDIEF